MTISPRVVNIGQSCPHFAALILRFILISIWLSFLGALPASAAIMAKEVIIPQQLGSIQNRVDGATGQPFIFVIDEEHVSLKVQQAVVDILRYLSGAYDVQLVCIEGYDKPLVIPRKGMSLVAQRFVARADFTAKRIDGVEYFAIAYPEVSVIGVEDMALYRRHLELLNEQISLEEREAKQWDADFDKFIEQDIGDLELEAQDVQRIKDALETLIEKKDFSAFAKVIYDVVGRESAIGKKLTTLEERWKTHKRRDQTGPTGTLEMQIQNERDRAIITNALRTIREKNTNMAILVVGKSHLGRIEELLNSQKISYVNIVPAWIDEPVSEEDLRIYRGRLQGESIGIEKLFTRIKAEPAYARPNSRDRTTLLGIVANADNLRRQGMPENDVLDIIKRSPLPNGVNIERVFDINGGQGIEFMVNDEKEYIYLSGNADQLRVPEGPEPVESGGAGGRYYAIYGGGGSGNPPIPPRGSGGSYGVPPDSFHQTYLVAIEKQRKQQPRSVTILFTVEDGRLVRWVDDKPKMVLGITPSDVKNLRERFDKAEGGPKKVFAAQQLADDLLVDLNTQFPEGRIELLQISENDLIGDISLRLVYELAPNKDASNLRSIEETKVHFIPWERAQQDLSSLGGEIVDKKLADKVRAMEVIRQETRDTKLKDVLSKPISEAKNARLMPAVETIARATIR